MKRNESLFDVLIVIFVAIFLSLVDIAEFPPSSAISLLVLAVGMLVIFSLLVLFISVISQHPLSRSSKGFLVVLGLLVFFACYVLIMFL